MQGSQKQQWSIEMENVDGQTEYVGQRILELIANDESWSDDHCELSNGNEITLDVQSMAKEILAYRRSSGASAIAQASPQTVMSSSPEEVVRAAIALCDEWGRMHKAFVRADRIEEFSYPPSVEDLREDLQLLDLHLRTLQSERDRLDQIINTPHTDDFIQAVSIEAEHQRQRWSAEDDALKTPADWFWLIGYLAGKGLHASGQGNTDKLLHHIVTTAAACRNWHRAARGESNMRPGIDGEAVLTGTGDPSRQGLPAPLLTIGDRIRVSDLADRLKVRRHEIVKALFRCNVLVTINQEIDRDTAVLAAEEIAAERARRCVEA